MRWGYPVSPPVTGVGKLVRTSTFYKLPKQKQVVMDFIEGSHWVWLMSQWEWLVEDHKYNSLKGLDFIILFLIISQFLMLMGGNVGLHWGGCYCTEFICSTCRWQELIERGKWEGCEEQTQRQNLYILLGSWRPRSVGYAKYAFSLCKGFYWCFEEEACNRNLQRNGN